MTKRKNPEDKIVFWKWNQMLADIEDIGGNGDTFRGRDLVNENRSSKYVSTTLRKLVKRGYLQAVEFRKAATGGNPHPVYRIAGTCKVKGEKHDCGEFVYKPILKPGKPYGVPELWERLRMGVLPANGITATRPPHLLDTPEDNEVAL